MRSMLRHQLRRAVVRLTAKPNGGAGVILLAKDTGRMLLGKRAPGTNQSGAWGMSGGGIKEDESTNEAAVRETREEAGIALDARGIVKAHVIPADASGGGYTTYIGLLANEATPKPGPEFTEWRWFAVTELPSNLYSALAEGLDQLLAAARRVLDTQ